MIEFWVDESACSERIAKTPSMGAVWDEEVGTLRTMANDVCASCPVRTTCLFAALQDPEAYGNRAGFFFINGKLNVDDADELEKQFGIRLAKEKTRQRTRQYTDAEVA